LWVNNDVEQKLSKDAIAQIMQDLVDQGQDEWLYDAKHNVVIYGKN
jgi:hypothetical protein